MVGFNVLAVDGQQVDIYCLTTQFLPHEIFLGLEIRTELTTYMR